MPDEPASSPDELHARVAGWLDTEGYPLEFATARKFREAGFWVFQSYYTRPRDGSPAREVDVVATLTSRDEDATFRRVEYVVECKRSVDKPWVFFVGDHGLAPSACVAQTVASELGEAILWREAGNERLMSLDTFSSRDGATAFGGRQAFSGSRDVVYDALRSVTGATRSLMERYNRPSTMELGEPLPTEAVIGLPVLVVEGRLFNASEQPSGGLHLEEVEFTRLHWRGAQDSLPHVTVDIVKASALTDFVTRRADESETILEVLHEGETDIRAWYESGEPMESLSMTHAPRGIVGGPVLFRRIVGLRDIEQMIQDRS